MKIFENAWRKRITIPVYFTINIVCLFMSFLGMYLFIFLIISGIIDHRSSVFSHVIKPSSIKSFFKDLPRMLLLKDTIIYSCFCSDI